MRTIDLLRDMPDDFAVTCENPERALEATLALVSLKAKLEASATAAPFARRGRRIVVVEGTFIQRAKALLLMRPDPDSAWFSLGGENTLASWEHFGIRWTMRIAMPERFPISDRRSSVEIARRVLDVAIAAMIKLSDPVELARGASLIAELSSAADSAAAQLDKPGIVACPAPIAMFGPEINHRALSGDEHTHVASPTLMARLSRNMPPCVNIWLNYTEHERFGHIWQNRHIGIYGDFELGTQPHDTIQRLRALSSIPSDETWAIES